MLSTFLMAISFSHHLLFPQYCLDDRLDEVVTIEFLDDLNRIDRSSFISCLLAPPPPRFAESITCVSMFLPTG